ncbi:hypothetical protein BH10ACT9_BH10ACT9_35530 [soil metagenome]
MSKLETPANTPDSPVGATGDVDKVITPEMESGPAERDTEAETELDELTREKLTKLRNEARNLRDRAKNAEARADTLARELFTARVTATGKVENPTEIAYNADLLDDTDAFNAAIDAAIGERPYIGKRRATGDVGQGHRGQSAGGPTFADLLK